jgi:ribosomal protein S18 acetylase RimI-like enzyme
VSESSALRLVELGTNPTVLPSAIELVEEYVRLPDAWHGSVPKELPIWFQTELAQFPGDASPPTGEVVVGLLSDAAVSVGLLRPVADSVAEIKRFYVRAEARRRGIGRSMAELLINRARSLGYERLMLDVMTDRETAVRLYRSVGFTDAHPYRTYPSLDVALTTLGMDL